MKRPFAILLTLTILCGITFGIALLVGLIASNDTTTIVVFLVGMAVGTFAFDIYRALRSTLAPNG
jgi:4-hydroxybenzoate polyprenyltransferase